MKRHLLLIDDDIDEVDFITGILDEMPLVKFSYALNGQKGIELMQAELPDTVLLDMNMPAMNGLECLQLIRKTEALQSIKVYMYSNSHATDFVNEAMSLGATGCFKKPTAIATLREILAKVLSE